MKLKRIILLLLTVMFTFFMEKFLRKMEIR